MTTKSLFLMDHLRENGGLRVAHELARTLQTEDDRVEFFVLQAVADGAVLQPDSAVRVIMGNRRRHKLRWSVPLGAVRLLRVARRFDVLVSASETGFMLLLGWLVSRLVRRPFVVLVQSPLAESIATWVPAKVQPFTRWVNARADCSICVSPQLIAGVVENGMPVESTALMTVGLDVERIWQLAREPAPLLPPGQRYVIAVGRLSRQKGFDLLIQAHAKVVAAGEYHSLYIVGEGPERARLEQLAVELGVADSVFLVGFLANPHPVLARADLFVLSSRQEGMGGIVLLEALGHGVPIVATDCLTGPRSLLDDGRLGELVPPENVDALAAAIEQHLRAPADLRSRALAGPDRAREFDPAHTAIQFVAVLRSLIARAPHGGSVLGRRPPQQAWIAHGFRLGRGSGGVDRRPGRQLRRGRLAAGTPTATESAETSVVTTAFAPTTTRSPT